MGLANNGNAAAAEPMVRVTESESIRSSHQARESNRFLTRSSEDADATKLIEVETDRCSLEVDQNDHLDVGDSRIAETAPLQSLLYARRILYVSHIFSQFSEVSWQFCLTLFLGAFANYESLILVSTYGLVSGLAVCLTGSWIGSFIDSTNRLVVAQRFIWTENVSVLLATALCYMLLDRSRQLETHQIDTTAPSDSSSDSWLLQCLKGIPLDGVSILLLVGIHLLGSLARILDRGFIVAIERDWIVVMSRMASASYARLSEDEADETGPHIPDEQQKTWLSETNVFMTQIDLSCKIVGPAVAGLFVAAFDDGTDAHHGGDLSGAALLVGAINVASLIAEYLCTMKIYQMIPELRDKTWTTGAMVMDDGSAEDSCDPEEGVSELQPMGKRLGCDICRLPYGLDVYFQQPISWGGLGLALLYLNALSFSSIMTAYLVWRGMGLETVGVWRGVSCAVGLLGTVVYNRSVRCMSLESTGMWSILFQFCSLSVSYVSLFVTDNVESLAMLITGVCASRVGLWVFDIAVMQQMQEYVPEDVRGVVGGVQEALNAFFELFSFGLGIIFPDPRKFHVYVSAGYASVGIGMLLYAFGIFFRRDKLTPQ